MTPDLSPLDPSALAAGEPQEAPPCRCSLKRFLPAAEAPLLSHTEQWLYESAGLRPPKLNVLLYRPDVQALQSRMLLAGFSIWDAMGGLAWIMQRQASWNLNYTDAPGQATVRLIPVDPPAPSSYLDRAWQKGGRITLATRIGQSSPWGLNTLWQVLTHELWHWMGSPFSWWAYDAHTQHPSDILCRAPYRRSMAEKHNPAAGTYWGLSYRELEWIRTRVGAPLVAT